MQLDYKRKGHYVACFNACRLFAAALRTRFESQSRIDPAYLGLTPFEADKLMRLFYKLWEVRPSVQTRRGRALGHLPADPDFNDKHGHRVAFARTVHSEEFADSYVPVLSQFRSFDEVGPPAERMMDERVDEDGYPLLVPLTTTTQLTRLILSKRLEEEDISFIQAFGRSTERLLTDEVIAVGRHERPEATEQSLVWELRRWHYWMDTALLNADLLESGDPLSSVKETAFCTWQAWSFALECIKKAGVEASRFTSDQTFYRDGMMRLAEYSDPVVSDLLRIQKSRDAIWKDAGVSGKRLAAFAAWACSTYLGGTLRKHPAFSSSRLAQSFRSLTDDDIERARSYVMRLHGLVFSDTPLSFEVDSLMALPSAAIMLPRVSDLTNTSVGVLAATARAATSRIYKNLIAPQIPEAPK